MFTVLKFSKKIFILFSDFLNRRKMRHFIQTRTMSMFSKSLKDFAMEKPPYTIIDPVLTTSYERDKISSKTHNILKSNVPSYVYGPDEEPSPFDVLIYQRHEIEAIRVSSAIAARCVRIAADFLQPGTTTSSLNDLLHQEIVSRNAYPSVLGFKQFPKAISTSVNNVACHGVPDNRPLEHGDIVSVDVTVYKDGFHGVCGRTFVIGKVTNNPIVRYLKSAAEECMFRGIAACLPGSRLIDIGAEIGKFSKKRNIKVIPTLNGHGIGKYFHCYPDVYHVLNNYPGKLKPGMVLTICPCISEGSVSIRILSDNSTVVTRDNSRTAQFEHTVLITEYGAELLSN